MYCARSDECAVLGSDGVLCGGISMVSVLCGEVQGDEMEK